MANEIARDLITSRSNITTGSVTPPQDDEQRKAQPPQYLAYMNPSSLFGFGFPSNGKPPEGGTVSAYIG